MKLERLSIALDELANTWLTSNYQSCLVIETCRCALHAVTCVEHSDEH